MHGAVAKLLPVAGWFQSFLGETSSKLLLYGRATMFRNSRIDLIDDDYDNDNVHDNKYDNDANWNSA